MNLTSEGRRPRRWMSGVEVGRGVERKVEGVEGRGGEQEVTERGKEGGGRGGGDR